MRPAPYDTASSNAPDAATGPVPAPDGDVHDGADTAPPTDHPDEPGPVKVTLGQRIGSYRLVSRLGDGGMGVVFKAVHEQLSRHAAIKILRGGLSKDPEMVSRFFTEAESVNIVRHPGIVNIFEFGQLPDQTVFIVMELLEGESLYDRLQRTPAGLGEPGLRIVRQMASALAAAHERGVVHRDLKPENVMIVADPDVPGGERAKLLDFGIAKMAQSARSAPLSSALPALFPSSASQASQASSDLDPSSPAISARHRVTRAGVIFGTPAYMSPEQCVDSGNVTDRSDVYALGVMLFEVASGHTPFPEDSPQRTLGRHLFEPPPDLRAVAPTTHPDVAALVARMLSKTAELRPPMRLVTEALDRHLEALHAPPPLPPPPPQLPRWARLLLAIGPTLALLGGAGAYGYALHQRALRARAQERDLGYLRSQAVGVLQERLRDGDPAVRRRAIELLQQSGDETHATLIEPRLRDDDLRVRARAAQALGQLRAREALPTLRSVADAAREPLQPALLLAAAGALRDLGAADGGTRLGEAITRLEALAQRGELITGDELMLLGRKAQDGDAAARDALAQKLRTPPDDGALRSAAALAQAGDGRGVGLLEQTSQDGGGVGLRAAWLLAQVPVAAAPQGEAFCATRGAPRFQGGLGDQLRPLEQRVLSIEGVGFCGVRAELPRLAPLLLRPEATRDGGALRLAAAGAVLRLAAGDPELAMRDAVSWTERSLQDKDWTRRSDAVVALGMMPPGMAVPLLRRAMHDDQPEVRTKAAWALSRLPAAAAMPLVEEMTKDQSPMVQAQARTSAQVLDGKAKVPSMAEGMGGPAGRGEGTPEDGKSDAGGDPLAGVEALAPEAALVQLRLAAHDGNAAMRLRAAEVAAGLQSRIPRAAEVLGELLGDRDLRVRGLAALSLVQTRTQPKTQPETQPRVAPSGPDRPADPTPAPVPPIDPTPAPVPPIDPTPTPADPTPAGPTLTPADKPAPAEAPKAKKRHKRKLLTNDAIRLPRRALHGKAGIDNKKTIEVESEP